MGTLMNLIFEIPYLIVKLSSVLLNASINRISYNGIISTYI